MTSTAATRNASPTAVAARASRPIYSTRTGMSNLPPSASDASLFAHLTDSPIVGDVVKAHSDLVVAFQSAAVAIDTHANTEAQATEEDALNLRAALRKSPSAADTGTFAADAWASQSASLLRRLNGLSDALADAYVEMVGEISANADALAEIHAADAASARSRLETLLRKAAAEVDQIDVATNAAVLLDNVVSGGPGTRLRPLLGSLTLMVEGYNNLNAADLLGRVSGYRAPVEPEPIEAVIFDDGLRSAPRRRR